MTVESCSQDRPVRSAVVAERRSASRETQLTVAGRPQEAGHGPRRNGTGHRGKATRLARRLADDGPPACGGCSPSNADLHRWKLSHLTAKLFRHPGCPSALVASGPTNNLGRGQDGIAASRPVRSADIRMIRIIPRARRRRKDRTRCPTSPWRGAVGTVGRPGSWPGGDGACSTRKPWKPRDHVVFRRPSN